MKQDLVKNQREDEFLTFAATKEIQKANSSLALEVAIKNISDKLKVRVVHKKNVHYLYYSLNPELGILDIQTALKLLTATSDKLNLKLVADVR